MRGGCKVGGTPLYHHVRHRGHPRFRSRSLPKGRFDLFVFLGRGPFSWFSLTLYIAPFQSLAFLSGMIPLYSRVVSCHSFFYH